MKYQNQIRTAQSASPLATVRNIPLGFTTFLKNTKAGKRTLKFLARYFVVHIKTLYFINKAA